MWKLNLLTLLLITSLFTIVMSGATMSVVIYLYQLADVNNKQIVTDQRERERLQQLDNDRDNRVQDTLVNISKQAVLQNARIIENQNENSERVVMGQERANVRGNITSDLLLTAINETRELQENITATDDIRGREFVRYLEAESDDMDEELDDLRNITLAMADYLNLTLPDEVTRDSIKFEDGNVTFENGTEIRLGDIFQERQ